MTKTKRKGLSRKERMAMAQTTAGISFWVDLRKGRLSHSEASEENNSISFSIYYFDFTWFCHPDTTVKVGKGRVYGSERTCK
mgnify:CR=1 FL=1